MKILFLSFYYSPDLCAGSFRSTKLIKAMLQQLPENTHIDIVTTLPNRYSTYQVDASKFEAHPNLTINRIKLPEHKSGLFDQAWSFLIYLKQVLALTKNSDYQLVIGTSSRLMTAALSAYLARKKGALLYLDIRDIFVDTLQDMFPKNILKPLVYFFSKIERVSISRADKVNLISKGFNEYFNERYPEKKYSNYSNCINSEFIGFNESNESLEMCSKSPLKVLYAGNIGKGQGLDKIIPRLAKCYEGVMEFIVIGDGGGKNLLQNSLKEENCKNVKIFAPMERDNLMVQYRDADILFVHLNDFQAFKKVLPSKLFEYAATGKPIWAGLSGYSADFVEQFIGNAVVFEPCNVNEAKNVFEDLDLSYTSRDEFIAMFSEDVVLKEMASDILSLI